MVATRIIMPETQVRLSEEHEPRRSGHVLCWCQLLLCGDKLLTTPNPDVNEGKCLNRDNPKITMSQPQTVEALIPNLFHEEKTKMVKTRA
jgi:biotin synthase